MDVLARAHELTEAGEEFALATVVWRQGPTSGKQGSRAIIRADGSMIGFIGGACTEPIVLREAKQVLADREAKLLLIGKPGQFGEITQGMFFAPMTCASEGAIQVYVEPITPATHLVVVGHSPMARTLVELAKALEWQAELVDASTFSAESFGPSSVVVVATQGHGDEEVLEAALTAESAYLGLVASRKRAATVLEFLADRGHSESMIGRIHSPVGLDLGPTTHNEIAVAVLAELVQRRAAGELGGPALPSAGQTHVHNDHSGHDHDHADHVQERKTLPMLETPEAIDPVCKMTVAATDDSYPYEYEGQTYWFCCLPCQVKFAKDPTAYLSAA